MKSEVIKNNNTADDSFHLVWLILSRMCTKTRQIKIEMANEQNLVPMFSDIYCKISVFIVLSDFEEYLSLLKDSRYGFLSIKVVKSNSFILMGMGIKVKDIDAKPFLQKFERMILLGEYLLVNRNSINFKLIIKYTTNQNKEYKVEKQINSLNAVAEYVKTEGEVKEYLNSKENTDSEVGELCLKRFLNHVESSLKLAIIFKWTKQYVLSHSNSKSKTQPAMVKLLLSFVFVEKSKNMNDTPDELSRLSIMTRNISKDSSSFNEFKRSFLLTWKGTSHKFGFISKSLPTDSLDLKDKYFGETLDYFEDVYNNRISQVLIIIQAEPESKSDEVDFLTTVKTDELLNEFYSVLYNATTSKDKAKQINFDFPKGREKKTLYIQNRMLTEIQKAALETISFAQPSRKAELTRKLEQRFQVSQNHNLPEQFYLNQLVKRRLSDIFSI